MIFNTQNFSPEVINSSQPVLVDFFATWCGPCQMQGPIIEELSKEYEGKMKIGKLNIDESLDIAQEYGVMSVPTLIVFQGGKEVKRMVGLQNKNELKSILDNLLKA